MRKRETMTRLLLLGSMGAAIPLADLPLLIEIGGPIMASIGHYMISRNRVKFWPSVRRDEKYVQVWLNKRMGIPWPENARSLDESGQSWTYSPDRIMIGQVRPDDDEMEDKLVTATGTAKRLIKDWSVGTDETKRLERNAKKLLKA